MPNSAGCRPLSGVKYRRDEARMEAERAHAAGYPSARMEARDLPLGRLGALGRSDLGTLLLGCILGPQSSIRGRFWRGLGWFWQDLGGSWEGLGRILANFWMNLGEIFAVGFLQALKCPDTASQSWEIFILHLFRPYVEGKHQVSWPSASEWPWRDSRSVNNFYFTVHLFAWEAFYCTFFWRAQREEIFYLGVPLFA